MSLLLLAELSTTKNSTAMAATTTSCVRYQRLIQVMQKVMTESRSQFDVNKAIQECYGEDASIFEQENNSNSNSNVLLSVMESMLDSVNDSVTDSMLQFLKENQVEAKLTKLEKILKKLEAQDTKKRAADAQDKESARLACEEAKLPEGLEPSDLIAYQAYQKILAEKQAMLDELSGVEQEIEQLEAQKGEMSKNVNSQIQAMEYAGKELEKSADICSTVS